MSPLEFAHSQEAHKQLHAFFPDERSRRECDALLRQVFLAAIAKHRPLNEREMGFLDDTFHRGGEGNTASVYRAFCAANEKDLVRAFLRLEEQVLLIADAYVENDESRREFVKVAILEDIRQGFLSPLAIASPVISQAFCLCENEGLPPNIPLP